jgi:LysM repeat protein
MKIRLPLRKAGPSLKRPPKLKLKASVARSRRAPIVEEEDFLEEPEPNMKLSHAFVVVLVLHVIAVAGVFAFNSIKARQADIFSAIKDEPAKAAAAPENAVASTGNPMAPAAAVAASDAAALTNSELAKPIAPAPVAAANPKTHELQPGETLTKIAKTYGVSVADLLAANDIPDATKMKPGMMLVIPGTTTTPAAPAKPETTSYKPLAIAPARPVPAPAVTQPVEKPAAAPAAVGSVKDSGKIYVVVKGDNPTKLAKRFKVREADLLSLNNIADPTKVQIGKKLKIPATAK